MCLHRHLIVASGSIPAQIKSFPTERSAVVPCTAAAPQTLLPSPLAREGLGVSGRSSRSGSRNVIVGRTLNGVLEISRGLSRSDHPRNRATPSRFDPGGIAEGITTSGVDPVRSCDAFWHPSRVLWRE